MEKMIQITENNINFIKEVYGIHKGINEISAELSMPSLPQGDLTILRINYLISVNIMELSIILKSLQQEDNTWRGIFYIKQSYLSVYETIKLYEKKLSPDLIKLLKEEDKLSHTEISLLFRNFKKKYSYSKEIKSVRNFATAHFDYNILDFLDTLEKLDKNKCIDMISEFIEILFILLLFISNIYERIADLKNINFSVIEENLNELIQRYKKTNGS